jgi:hypothetical protein
MKAPSQRVNRRHGDSQASSLSVPELERAGHHDDGPYGLLFYKSFMKPAAISNREFIAFPLCTTLGINWASETSHVGH